MNKGLKISLVIAFAVLLFQTVFISNLERRIEKLTSSHEAHYNDISQNINNLNSQILGTLNDELSKTHLTKEVTYKIDKANDTGYTLDIRTELSRLGNDSKVMFLYKATNSNQWTEVEMINNGQLSFTCKIDVDSDKDYTYKVTTVGALSESGDIDTIYKDVYLPIPPYVSGYGNDGNNLNINLVRDLYKDNNSINYDIKKVEALVKANGIEKTYEFKESKHEYTDEYGKLVDGGFNYDVNIPNEDIEGNLEYIKMKVSYDNGVIDIRDITDQIDHYYLKQN